MSRSHTDSQSTADEGAESASSQPSANRWLFPLSLTVGAVWWVILLSLAIKTANPVTLNVRQLVQADLVVLGRIVDVNAGRVEVQRQWLAPEALPQTVVVDHLDQTAVEPGQSYLLPLSRTTESTLEVTPRRLAATSPGQQSQKSTGYVYPASAETIQRLETVLSQYANRDRN